ncbi:MAG: sulfur carrier protein ThiS [Burkholderiales bacterium]
MISLTVNGELRQYESAMSVAALVEGLALSGRRFAVEKNGSVVPRSRFDQETVGDGDRLEIIVAVGGG